LPQDGDTGIKSWGASMMRTIYAYVYGALIFFAALLPPVILIIDKAGF
jgi:hypothetical protein